MSTFIVSTLLAFSLILTTFSAYATPLPVGTVLASAHDGNLPEYTLDRNLATRWSAKGAGQWIRYGLEPCDTVQAIKIAWYKGDERTSTFDIEVSDDGATWTKVHSGVSSGHSAGFETIDIDDASACFLRIIGYGNSASDWNSIAEVAIEGDVFIPPYVIPATVVEASGHDGNLPEYATDLNLSTRWSSQGSGQWITLYLGELGAIFDQLSIAWYRGDTRSAAFSIEASMDGIYYTEIYGGFSSGTTSELQAYRFAPSHARYVRIAGHGNNLNDWNSIVEIEIMNTSVW